MSSKLETLVQFKSGGREIDYLFVFENCPENKIPILEPTCVKSPQDVFELACWQLFVKAHLSWTEGLALARAKRKFHL